MEIGKVQAPIREEANEPNARLIAFYLPQFHPIPENDNWWGKGFTEWTNVAKATPLFPGHYQPHIPADLGFYDLRVPETRRMQAEMARDSGIEGFCYYHYWFGGKQLLERPFEEVLQSGEPDFPFCLCWANQSWTGIWHGAPGRMLIEQTYPGYDDHDAHFYTLLKAFLDRRYLTVDGKPLFLIYRPREIPNANATLEFWRELAVKNGLKGLHVVGVLTDVRQMEEKLGCDGFVVSTTRPRHVLRHGRLKRWMRRIVYRNITRLPTIFSYARFVASGYHDESTARGLYPLVIPNWDNTPRSGYGGVVLHGSTPELFRTHLKGAITAVRNSEFDHRLVFVKSWNEWAEGNHLEPDLRFGIQYLNVTRDEVFCSQSSSVP